MDISPSSTITKYNGPPAVSSMKFTLTAVAAVLLVQCALGMDATDRRFDCRCGQRNRDMRIVGGTEAGPNEFPWQAHLYRKAAGGRGTESFCGGSIISDRLILTAAHCFFDHNGAPTHRRSHSISAGWYQRERRRYDDPRVTTDLQSGGQPRLSAQCPHRFRRQDWHRLWLWKVIRPGPGI